MVVSLTPVRFVEAGRHLLVIVMAYLIPSAWAIRPPVIRIASAVVVSELDDDEVALFDECGEVCKPAFTSVATR